LRPSLTAAVNLFINAGQLTAIGIGNTRFAIMLPSSYKVIFAAQWAFPCFIALLAMFMPESPWYLLRKGQVEQAKKSLQRLHLKATDTAAILEEIQASIAAENTIADIQKDTSYWDCFRGTNWRRTRISCGMFAVQQFTGIAFYSQALYFLGISSLPTALTFQLALGGFGVAMLGNIISWFIMNYVGKPLSFYWFNVLGSSRLMYRASTSPFDRHFTERSVSDVRRCCWMFHHHGCPLLYRLCDELCPNLLCSHRWSCKLDHQRRGELGKCSSQNTKSGNWNQRVGQLGHELHCSLPD
jgi:hypothetical protein